MEQSPLEKLIFSRQWAVFTIIYHNFEARNYSLQNLLELANYTVIYSSTIGNLFELSR